MRIAPTLIKSMLKRRKVGILDSTAKIGWKAQISNLTGDPSNLKVGRFSKIDGEIIVYPGAKVLIGDYCYIGANTRVWAYSNITFENYVIVAHNVSIMDSNTHPVSFSERRLQLQNQLSGTPMKWIAMT